MLFAMRNRRRTFSIAPLWTRPVRPDFRPGLCRSILKLNCPRKRILQKISVRRNSFARLRAAANWAISVESIREPGNSIAASESCAYTISLAAGDRRARSAGVVRLSLFSLGDQADLRPNARARRPGGGIRGAKSGGHRPKIHE